jgi:hypothetical protein
MRLLSTIILLTVTLCACQHPNRAARVVRASSPSEYPGLVGQRIELVGVVTQTKCPQILGVDLWELEEYRGRRMRVTGILRQSVETQAQIEEAQRRMGGVFANRGPGTFYYLDGLKYAPEP